MAKVKIITAALVIIGNEVLSGRTQDANVKYLGEKLNSLGIRLLEVRVIPDVEESIIDAVNNLRRQFDYIFTTGGIGPTHDDITTASISKAFGIKVVRDPEAERLVRSNYVAPRVATRARLKMADVPEGSVLLKNPVSKAPGFRVENVYVLAGVPSICQAMFHSLKHELVGGDPMRSVAIAVYLAEGTLAKGLTALQDKYLDVGLGSYPFYRDGRFGASIVARSQSPDRLSAAANEIRQMIRDLDGEPIEEAEY